MLMRARKLLGGRRAVVRALEALANAVRIATDKMSEAGRVTADAIDAAAENVADSYEPPNRSTTECPLCNDTGYSAGGWYPGPCHCAMGVLREEAEKAGLIEPVPETDE